MTASLYEKTLQLVDAAVETEGAFSALVASFSPTPDRQGDVIHRGAFVASLARWRKSGQKIPVVWSHQTQTPSMVVGGASATKSHETAEGLVLVGQLNVYGSTVAAHVRDLLKSGDISGWSFGFKIVRSSPRPGGLNLLELDIGEAGPTVFPASADTRTLSVKNEAPDRREPERLSHTQMENLLRQRGILGRMVPPFEPDEIDQLHGAYRRRRRNGGDEDADEHRKQMLALLKGAAPSTKTAPPAIRIATFKTVD